MAGNYLDTIGIVGDREIASLVGTIQKHRALSMPISRVEQVAPARHWRVPASRPMLGAVDS